MFGVFDAGGIIALKERLLMLHAVELMLIVVIPVYILTFFFAWHYRASNKKSKAVYMPNWQHAKMDELIWWVIPFEIVLIIGALTWTSTHELDPRKPLTSPTPPITIEVVAQENQWLFIYPDQHFTTTKEIEFPVNTPVHFKITSDAAMNSFWIPQLGGQMYAMTGMTTELTLMADRQGSFAGSSANYSGPHFAEMKFTARAVSNEDFTRWTMEEEQTNPAQDGLFDSIVSKYQNPDAPHDYHD